jgi:hypothetical protein
MDIISLRTKDKTLSHSDAEMSIENESNSDHQQLLWDLKGGDNKG